MVIDGSESSGEDIAIHVSAVYDDSDLGCCEAVCASAIDGAFDDRFGGRSAYGDFDPAGLYLADFRDVLKTHSSAVDGTGYGSAIHNDGDRPCSDVGDAYGPSAVDGTAYGSFGHFYRTGSSCRCG